MKRSSLHRGSKPLKRRTPLRKVNPERAAKKWERNFGPHRAFIAALACLVCGRRPVHAAHLDARGMGGCGGDASVLVPLCAEHHRAQEGRTDAYAAEVGIDLRAVAAALWEAGGWWRSYCARELDRSTIEHWRTCAAAVIERSRRRPSP